MHIASRRRCGALVVFARPVCGTLERRVWVGSTRHIATMRAIPTASGNERCCRPPRATGLMLYRLYVADSASDENNRRTTVSSSFSSKMCTICASWNGSASRWRLTTKDESNTTAEVQGNAMAMCSARPPPSECPVVTIVSFLSWAATFARRRISATTCLARSYWSSIGMSCVIHERLDHQSPIEFSDPRKATRTVNTFGSAALK